MGTQVHYKSYLAGFNPMRDLNDDSNSNGWPIFFGDKSLANGQYYTGFTPRTIADAYPGSDKNALKQKMLEHEDVFKKQVYELHRLYRIQRDMMEEMKMKELHRYRPSIEISSSSSHQGSQAPSEDARRWHLPSYPLVDRGYARSAVSGAEIVNSPLSCTKGSRVTSQNGGTKDFEILEARPSKVRKKLFDLQLPAAEYIDTEDAEQQDTKVSNNCSFAPNVEHNIASDNSVKLSIGCIAAGKTGSLPEGLTSLSHFKSSTGLADLNEPVELEEASASSSTNIVGHSTCNGRNKGIDLSAKPDVGFLGLSKEVMQKSHHGSHNGAVNNLTAENKVGDKEWLPYTYEAGHGRSNLSSFSRGIQQDKTLTTKAQVMLHQDHPPGFHLSDHSKEDLWRKREGWRLEASERRNDYTNNSHLEHAASQVLNPYPPLGSSDVANTWPHLVSSWAKPADSLTQKLASGHMHPSLVSSSSLHKSLQSAAQNLDSFGEKWHVNSSSHGLGSDPRLHNGFYHGSSSGSKDLPVCFPSVGFDYLYGSRSDIRASEHFISNGLMKAPNNPTNMDIKLLKDVNLNVVSPKDALYNSVPQQHLEIIDGQIESEDQQAVLPWLRAKPGLKNETTTSTRYVKPVNSGLPQASSYTLFGKTETGRDLSQMFNASSASTNHEIRPSNETPSVKKILGFPIFENLSASENKASSPISSNSCLHPAPEGEHPKKQVKHRLIDINVACDASLLEYGHEPAAEETVVEKSLDKNASCVRSFIDLNSCFAEDEDPPVPHVASNTNRMKFVVDIDLEAPAVSEEEEVILPEKENEQERALQPTDHITEQAVDEVVKSAAEAIVDISLSCQHINQNNTSPPFDASLAESLVWFADVVSSTVDKYELKSGREGSVEEMDDFEAMILQLPETKEEDYMPKPFVPEAPKVEETGNIPTRPRRGQARRGRQRRDFQKDILPGLASLSRHEVTEDLQTFGGLMRATGHAWNSGLTRRSGGRNGGTRGRRRALVESTPTAAPNAACTPLVQQLNNIETGLQERSLTGWGKTPRRPRRQRCPAGNPPPAPLT